jgi:hypothetical protein
VIFQSDIRRALLLKWHRATFWRRGAHRSALRRHPKR